MGGFREQRRRGTTGTVGPAERECGRGCSREEKVEVEGGETQGGEEGKGTTVSRALEGDGTWEGNAGEVWETLGK